MAFSEVITHENEAELCSVTFSTAVMIIAHTISTETGNNVEKSIISLSTLLDLISFKDGPGT